MTFVVALVIAVGLVGIVVPVLPGVLLVWGALLVWAVSIGTSTSWIVFSLCSVLLAAGAVVKFTVPGRRLKNSGVPNSTLFVGGALGVVGFFVVPVVGLFLGFVLGVYLAEHRRLGAAQAWPSSVGALKAVGLSMLIELLSAVAATVVWIVGVFLV
ncbi:DUF456 domain-containing protein [Nocardioides yefusunii]|uniref:DUF456 domain-containing protein n=1 Tax=Nocardioides yefusunii TaxID=2500546 RepID=A0ABW1QWL1_9ACTN|nr:DUF456 domain-containing protein [Nocardioides yefusunii]